MADLTTYTRNKLYDHILRNTTYTSPTTVYVGLLDTGGTELTGNGYAREVLTMGAPTAGVGTNSVKVTFDTATGGDWSEATDFAVFDAISAGNKLASEALDAAKTVTEGNFASFAIGALSVSVAITGWSTYLRNEIYDHVFRNAAWTSPTTIYSALYTDDPGVGDTGTELAAGNYVRKSIAFDAPSDGVGDNTAQVTFATSDTNHGTITHQALKDAETVGNMLIYGALTTSRAYNIDDTIRIPADDCVVTIA